MTTKRSLFASIALVGALLAAAASSAVADVKLYVIEKAVAARDWLVAFVLAPTQMTQPPAGQLVQREPAVLLVAARAFVARLLRRETPHIEAGWRMCPSV